MISYNFKIEDIIIAASAFLQDAKYAYDQEIDTLITPYKTYKKYFFFGPTIKRTNEETLAFFRLANSYNIIHPLDWIKILYEERISRVSNLLEIALLLNFKDVMHLSEDDLLKLGKYLKIL